MVVTQECAYGGGEIKPPYITPQRISDAGLKIQLPNLAKTPDLFPWSQEEATQVHMDLGGPMRVDAKLFEAKLLDTVFSVYAIHASEVEHELRVLNPRPSGLYLLGTWPAATVLTSEERDVVLAWLARLVPEAHAYTAQMLRELN